MDFINKLKEGGAKDLETFDKWISDASDSSDDDGVMNTELLPAFEKLQKSGKNTVEEIIQWLKTKGNLLFSKDAEAKVREELNKAADKTNVTFTEFKDAMVNMAEREKKNVEELATTAKDATHKLASAFNAGTSALKGVVEKKDAEKK